MVNFTLICLLIGIELLNFGQKMKKLIKKKMLVKVKEKEIFKVFYNKGKANYNNKSFYEFEVNRDLKRRLKQRIKDGLIDAFKI